MDRDQRAPDPGHPAIAAPCDVITRFRGALLQLSRTVEQSRRIMEAYQWHRRDFQSRRFEQAAIEQDLLWRQEEQQRRTL